MAWVTTLSWFSSYAQNAYTKDRDLGTNSGMCNFFWPNYSNSISCRGSCLRKGCTHSSFMGLADVPLSPPTITQSIPVRSIVPKSESRGSQEKNLTLALRFLRWSILNFVRSTSTVTPSHAFLGIGWVEKYSAIRSARFVNIWYLCLDFRLFCLSLRNKTKNYEKFH